MKEALNSGAAYLLEKPFTTDSLRGVLEKVTGVDVDLAKLVTRALSKARLTRKEEEVARLVLKGLTSKGNIEKIVALGSTGAQGFEPTEILVRKLEGLTATV